MRKYKFSPKTGLLVAGLIVGAYAEACYTNPPTQAICFRSGDTVDTIYWPSYYSGFTAASTVTATADWTHGYQSAGAGTLSAYITGSGYASATPDTPVSCYGPAEFTDPAGNTDTVPYWENGAAASGSPGVPTNPKNDSSATWGEVDTSVTCQ